jgi:PAS domain S-box-containing protein
LTLGDTEVLPSVNVGDRAYFLKQKAAGVDQLVISEPLLSRFTGKWLITLSRPMFNAKGEFGGVVQMALRAEYFQSLFERIDAGQRGNVSLFDIDWRLLSRHPMMPDLLGQQFVSVAADSINAGKSPVAYEAPSKVDGTVRLFVARRLSGLPYTLIIGRSTNEFLYSWYIKAALYAIGYIALALALGTLLLMYHRYNEYNRRLIMEAFEASGDAIVVTDASGKMINANRAFTTITGYSLEEAKGRPLAVLLRSDRHDEAFYGEISDQIAKVGLWRGEIWHRHKNGATRPNLLVVSTLRNRDGEITNCVGVFNDISALHAARQQAESANRAKGAFLATMSHEIRTPLNGILGMAQLLLMESPGKPADVQDYARTILNSGNTLLTLLNDILDLSKVEAGKLEIKNAPFMPAQLLDELQALFRDSAGGKQLAFTVTWQGPQQARYSADSMRLRQILSNLINNAIKFTPTGQVSVDGREVSMGDEVLLEFDVRDSGIGIPSDRQQELFKPFSQIDDSNTRQFGGTGLGLSIVRSLTELMGGSVSCESEAEQGACFRVRVKAERLAEMRDTRVLSRAVGAPASITVASPGHYSLLLVEDNLINQKVIRAMLERLGCRVHCVENGKEAVDAIRAGQRPDLIVMDCQTPIMDGFEATRQIRVWEETQSLPRLPIVALTAAAFDADRIRSLEAGMDDFMTKPASLQNLRDTLKKYLPHLP